MKVWIFNHYAQPPQYPGGTRHFDLAKSLNFFGCDVTIFASSFHYTLLKELLPKFKLSSKETFDGVEFVLLKTSSYKKNGVRRLINIITYPISLFLYLLSSSFVKPDIIIGSTVHPFASLFGCLVAKFFKIPHVFEIRDLWPETFIDMNVWRKSSFISSFFYAVEKFTVKHSSAYIVLSPMTTSYLISRYQIEQDSVLLLPNGVNESFYKRQKVVDGFNVVDKVTIKYVGGLDSVHGLDFLIDLAKYLPVNYDVVLVGDGKDKARLVSKAKTLNLHNVTFLPPVPKSEVPKVLSDSDLLFLCTADVFYGSENKLYEYMAAAKPIVVASNASHNNPVIDLGCGIVLDRNDVLESSINLKDFVSINHDRFSSIGLKGYDYVIENRTTTALSKKLLRFLQGICL